MQDQRALLSVKKFNNSNGVLYKKSSIIWICIRWLIIPFLFLIVILGCKDTSTDEYNHVVLQVGEVKISAYEFRKHFERFKSTRDHLGDRALQKWLKEYRDNALLTAEAYQSGYEQDSMVVAVVKNMADYMLVKYDGFVWNALEEPKLEISEAEIEAAYQKTGKVYYFDFLSFKKGHVPQELLDKIEEGKLELKEAADRFDTLFTYGRASGQWPLVNFAFARDVIRQLNVGELSKPQADLYGKVFIFQLYQVEKVQKKPFKSSKEKLKERLYRVKEMEVLHSFEQRFNSHCRLTYYNKALSSYLDEIRKEHGQQLSIQEGSMNKGLLSTTILASYFLQGQPKDITVKDFDHFRNTYPVVKEMRSIEDIKDNLVKMVKQQYLLIQADSLKLRSDLRFRLEMRNFKHRMMRHYYLNDSIDQQIEINEDDMRKVYAGNEAYLYKPEYIQVEAYGFNTYSKARKSYRLLSRLYSQRSPDQEIDTAEIPELTVFDNNLLLLEEEFERKIDYNNLLSLEIGNVSLPVLYNDKYYLFADIAKGPLVKKPYRNVKGQIRSKLQKNRFEARKKKLVDELRKKYTIEIDELESQVDAML